MIRYCLPLILLAAPVAASAQMRTQDTLALDRAVATFTGHPMGDLGSPTGAAGVAAVAAPAPFVLPVKAVPVIKRGDPVTVEAGSSGFSITREGIAMGDAPIGGRLLVKVDDTRAPVQAIALESGRATLPGLDH